MLMLTNDNVNDVPDRRLVTVRTINELKSIENADAIELALIDGWRAVVKKNQFKVGDKCVYFEIDSFLPITDKRYEFLHKNKSVLNGIEGVKIKTMVLRGCLSQGLAMPIADFPEIVDYNTDLDKLLGITKWETSTDSQFGVMSNFPATVKKTTQPRIQNMENIFERYGDMEFEATDKMDGMSLTILFDGKDIKICTANGTLEEENNICVKTVDSYGYREYLKTAGFHPVAIQGELMKLGFRSRFFVFNVFNVENRESFPPDMINTFINDGNQYKANHPEVYDNLIPFERVQVIDRGTLRYFGKSPKDLLDYANFWNKITSPTYSKPLNGQLPIYRKGAEGVVFKSLDGTVSFKVISNNYLLNK